MTMESVNKSDIEYIALGASLLGTGGGGDPLVGKLMALSAIEKYGGVELISIDELRENEKAATFCMVGAPTVGVEKIPNFESLENVYTEYEKYYGYKINAIVPSEIGGVNSMIPFVIAAMKGIPVVDADGMGRAFPEMQMDTFSIAGIPNTPSIFADEKGNSFVVTTEELEWTEKISRSLVDTLGGSLMNGVYLLDALELKRHAVPNTVSLARELGKVIKNFKNPIAHLVQDFGMYCLFTGKIIDVERKTVGGFVRGKASLLGLEDSESHGVIEFQNENLIFLINEEVKCTTPDLITLVDDETGVPITTENLRFGMRCSVIASKADPRWRTETGIKTVGPRYFGYDYDYVPVENLFKDEV